MGVFPWLQWAALRKEDVEPAVAIVIEQADSSARRFDGPCRAGLSPFVLKRQLLARNTRDPDAAVTVGVDRAAPVPQPVATNVITYSPAANIA